MFGRKPHLHRWSDADEKRIKSFIGFVEQLVQKLRDYGSAACASYERHLVENVTEIKYAFAAGDLQEAERLFNEILLDVCLVRLSLEAEIRASKKYGSPKEVNVDEKNRPEQRRGIWNSWFQKEK